jgi:hypothetical protein
MMSKAAAYQIPGQKRSNVVAAAGRWPPPGPSIGHSPRPSSCAASYSITGLPRLSVRQLKGISASHLQKGSMGC